MTLNDRHHPVLGGQLELLNLLHLDLFGSGQVDLVPELFELPLELQVLVVQRLQFLVMGRKQLNDVDLSLLHNPSVPSSSWLQPAALTFASGGLT